MNSGAKPVNEGMIAFAITPIGYKIKQTHQKNPIGYKIKQTYQNNTDRYIIPFLFVSDLQKKRGPGHPKGC